MKQLFATLVCILTLGANAKAQGLINFFNSAATLITRSTANGLEPLPPIAEQYYFQLFLAPAGSGYDATFTPVNVIGTNQAAAGRFSGGAGVAVLGATAGSTMAILVRGWSASLGADYATAWDNFQTGVPGGIGSSEIAPNFVFGGFDGIGPIPASPAFGGPFGIQRGFVIGQLLPEPSATALALPSLVALVFSRRRQRRA
jgi:hypothetical protein